MGAGFVQYFNSLSLDMARAAPRRFKNFGPPIVAVAKARGIGCDRSVRKWVQLENLGIKARPDAMGKRLACTPSDADSDLS
jgi:hypothetical protein